VVRRCLLVAAAVVAPVVGCGGDEGGDLEAYCATARQFSVDNPAAVFDRYDPEDPSSAATLLREAAASLDDWAGDAPGEVAGSIEVIADAAEDLASAFEEPTAGGDDSLRDAVEAVETASAQVVTFTRDQCDVDLEPTSTVTVVLGTTTTLALEG
jgi:hypothetical protein